MSKRVRDTMDKWDLHGRYEISKFEAREIEFYSRGVINALKLLLRAAQHTVYYSCEVYRYYYNIKHNVSLSTPKMTLFVGNNIERRGPFTTTFEECLPLGCFMYV